MIGYTAIFLGGLFIIVGLGVILYFIAIWFKANEKFQIDIARQGNFIVALLMVYFIFYGFVANVYGKSIGEDILFTYKILFNPRSWFSIFILMVIVIFLIIRETFFEYGIRNSIMLTPFIVGMAWIWYWFIVDFDITVIPLYFIRFEAYLSIISILGINLITAIIAAILKQIYKEFIKTTKELIIKEV